MHQDNGVHVEAHTVLLAIGVGSRHPLSAFSKFVFNKFKILRKRPTIVR